MVRSSISTKELFVQYNTPVNVENNIAEEIVVRRNRIYEYILSERLQQLFSPEHMRGGVFSYAKRPGKGLRGTGCLLACGAVGGQNRERLALPAAATTEIHHIWSLIHDDIIDLDDVRKGSPTVHVEYKQRAIEEFGYDSLTAERYGTALAILSGDGGAGLAFICLCDLFQNSRINPEVVQLIIQRYASTYIPDALEGQTLDIQLEGKSLTELREEDLLHVCMKKTGTFFGLGGFTGSLIGINEPDPEHPFVQIMNGFTVRAGMILQLTDDLLNIVGDEAKLGKSVGSDVILGKKTLPIVHAFTQANSSQREQLLSCYGNSYTAKSELTNALQLINELGGVAHTRDLVSHIVNEALEIISQLPRSEYTDLLSSWIKWISTRRS